jgi:hypothetical protein
MPSLKVRKTLYKLINCCKPHGAALFPDGGGNGKVGRKHKAHACREVYKEYGGRAGGSLTSRRFFLNIKIFILTI